LTPTRNIEQSKRVEEDLRVSAARWSRLFDQAPMSIQIFAPDGTTLRVNAAFRSLFPDVVEDIVPRCRKERFFDHDSGKPG
jgi:PAS domain-containing protein